MHKEVPQKTQEGGEHSQEKEKKGAFFYQRFARKGKGKMRVRWEGGADRLKLARKRWAEKEKIARKDEW